jgi:hypothetical protein
MCIPRGVTDAQDFADEIGADKEDLFDDTDGFSVWTCSTGGSGCADACEGSACSPGER